jgi:hypothetical protein
MASLGAINPVVTRRPGQALTRVALISLAYGALLVVGLGLRRDMHELPGWFLLGFGAIWIAAFGAALAAAMLPRRRQVVPDVGRARRALIPVLTAIALIGLLMAQQGPSSVISTGSLLDFALHAPRCIGIALVVSLVPIWVGSRALRHAVPTGAAWIAAVLGAGGGALGGLVLHLHCPIADGPHVGFVHGGAMALAGLLAAWLAARTMEP